MKQKITTRLLATLLLTVGSLAAIPLTTVLTGCTEEELFKTPPAEIANPELKPGEIAIHLNVPPLTGFGEAGTRTPGTGTGDHDLGKTSWAVGDELMMQLGIQGSEPDPKTPIAYRYSIFTTATCTDAGNGGTTAKWQLSATPQDIYRSATSEQYGDLVPMPPTFNPFGEQGKFILPAELERCTQISVSTVFYYTPGTRWVTDNNEVRSQSLPTAATTGTLEKWSLEYPLSNSSKDLEPIGAADTAEEAAEKRKANAPKLATLFTLDLSKDRNGGNNNAFEHDKCGRLRIATFPGAKVQIATNCFAPAAKRTTCDANSGFVVHPVTEADGVTPAVTVDGDATTYLDLDGKTPITVGSTPGTADENGSVVLIPAALPVYTTTADALGNAYFYGLIGEKKRDGSVNTSAPIDGMTGKELIVSVSLPATGGADGSAAAKGAKQVIFRATKKAKVSLENGGSVKIDGNTVNTGKMYAVNVNECTDAAGLTAKLVAAHTAGQTMWAVTGKAGDTWSGGTNTIGADYMIADAICAALNTIHATHPNARISLYLPTMVEIAQSAFYVNPDGTTNGGLLLQSITAPMATTIVGSAFRNCAALTTAHLPVATSIDYYAFQDCVALTTAHLPVAATIGGSAFTRCTALTTAHLPAATTIGDYAFEGCAALTTAHLPAATSIGNSAFTGCAALTTAHLPVATSIGDLAFRDCVALTTAHLPAATSIGNYAFFNCAKLTTLNFGTSPITKWGSDVLTDLRPSNITLTLAPGQKDFKQDGTGAVEPETPVQFGTGKSFAGYEFKEIKQAK